MSRTEILTRGQCEAAGELAPGVTLRVFVAGTLGSKNLSTGTATFASGAELPYHRHGFSEVITLLSGEADVLAEGRRYRVRPHDATHLPAGTPHMVRNPGPTPAVFHWAFATDTPSRELVDQRFTIVDRRDSDGCPERVMRFETAPVYELAPRAWFRDLFASRFGCRGLCGGYGVFEPGASLPCHYHGYDESISIIDGTAICQVAGREYALSGCDTACIPTGRPHRFINRSTANMAMIWVYAGDEPDRVLVEPGFCEGTLPLTSLPTA
jgi:quercetin dioxygenase-like cupin family protein